MLLSCSTIYCQNNTSNPSTGSLTLSISLDTIKLVNAKLIENKYNKIIINKQDSIISLYKSKDIEYNNIINDFQIKLDNSNKINNSLNNKNNKYKKRNKILGYTTIGSVAFGVLKLLIK